MESRMQQQDEPPEEGEQGQVAVDVRCCCGSLLAKLVEGGVQLKCRRCKKVVVVPFDPKDAGDDIKIGPREG